MDYLFVKLNLSKHTLVFLPKDGDASESVLATNLAMGTTSDDIANLEGYKWTQVIPMPVDFVYKIFNSLRFRRQKTIERIEGLTDEFVLMSILNSEEQPWFYTYNKFKSSPDFSNDPAWASIMTQREWVDRGIDWNVSFPVHRSMAMAIYENWWRAWVKDGIFISKVNISAAP